MASHSFAFADVVIDAGAHRLLRADKEVPVEPKAFAVLLAFLARPGQLLSRDQLLDAVWGHSYVTPATLNRIVAQLRKALGDDAENPHCIQTVHGLGYRFIASLKEVPDATAPALRFAPPSRARIPERTGPLIGRAHDIEELRRLLSANRLLTVTGPGGIGKTQAALETARAIATDFPDGVWLFDCTAQCDRDAVMRLLAGVFDIRVACGVDELIEHLCDILRSRCALLLFDNCERIAEVLGEVVSALQSACGQLRVLVTSQRRLNCVGESLYPLPPLEVPAPGEWNTGEAVACLSEVAAVHLLLTRSRAFASSFALTPANAPAVAEICRRLDGLPLALELAVARLRLLSPEQLLLRMDDRFHWLADANHGRPARHQTLGALIEWSFALLSEREHSLLCGLGLFAGGCTLAGANAIGTAIGLDDEQTLDLLGGLIDKSLLTVDTAANPPRYRLLDSVRLFAQAQLAQGGNDARVRRAHLAHFVAFTERVNAELREGRERIWIERVRREWANLQQAFDYAMEQADLRDNALALVGNLCWYFRAGIDYLEAAHWLGRALEVTHPPTRHYARTLIADGVVSHFCHRHERAASSLNEGIELARRLGEAGLAAAGEATLAFELAVHGECRDVETRVESALAVANASNDAWLRSLALLSRGIAHSVQDRHQEAECWMDQAAEQAALLGTEHFQLFYTVINRGLQRFYIRDTGGAAGDWLFALDYCARLQIPRGAAGCVEGAAYLAGDNGQSALAARFLAAAARVRGLTVPLFAHWRKAQERAIQQTRDALGDSFGPAQREGAAARFEDIVAQARALLKELASTQDSRGTSKPAGS
ncbi:MAG TPA: winged helix-turn-helix domain-containing protein [Rhodanobacteraceae bacterium]|nr:winged helix-turn-helix domain-containing protein [Rhodanobacteraceae bacterium]